LADAVFYQVYPASFADSNGDGIGDLAGITDHLDYLRWLGVSAVWINPCFPSAFRDGGYDITDYFSIAARYGTIDDLVSLVDAAHGRGIRVLLDLVPGHTSDRHPWFIASANGEDAGEERYIWAPGPVDGFVAGPGRRPDWYLPNFYAFQPALNFGYARRADGEPWRQPVEAPGPRANRAVIREIMTHWLDLGVDGFRVDMASSLVKDDQGWTETGKLWGEVRAWLDSSYPDAALLAEWGVPEISVPAGFHVDFFLHFAGVAMRSLWDTGVVTEPGWSAITGFFDAEGKGVATDFLAAWLTATAAIGNDGYVALPTSNHDYARLASGPRVGAQLAPAMTFLLTWPTLPTIYYGDEIGMRYLPGLPDKEGSTFTPTSNRAGSRTPMQWEPGAGAGFSTAPPEQFYLPIDSDPNRPTVAEQRSRPDSLLNLVRRLVELRRATPALGSQGEVDILHAGYPLVYRRSHGAERFLVAVNPSRRSASTDLPALTAQGGQAVLTRGAELSRNRAALEPFGYGVFRLTD
jgi:maltose alpha-D-glucosyltransferase/alpha-amylase